MSWILDWVNAYKWWLVGLSVLTFLGTLVTIPVIILRMPADYFMYREPPPDSWRGQHRVVRVTLIVAKNALGLLLVMVGLLLIPLPGQGLLTVVAGIFLLDFPGKRQLELRFARQRPLLRAINWIRERAGRAPLVLPPRERRQKPRPDAG
jgi:hypothetical protein